MPLSLGVPLYIEITGWAFSKATVCPAWMAFSTIAGKVCSSLVDRICFQDISGAHPVWLKRQTKLARIISYASPPRLKIGILSFFQQVSIDQRCLGNWRGLKCQALFDDFTGVFWSDPLPIGRGMIGCFLCRAHVSLAVRLFIKPSLTVNGWCEPNRGYRLEAVGFRQTFDVRLSSWYQAIQERQLLFAVFALFFLINVSMALWYGSFINENKCVVDSWNESIIGDRWISFVLIKGCTSTVGPHILTTNNYPDPIDWTLIPPHLPTCAPPINSSDVYT